VKEKVMRGLKRLLVPVIVAAALAGLSLPANAGASATRRLERSFVVEYWGPVRQVPLPTGNIGVLATAMSVQGHIAVAYTAGGRIREGRVPGFVIVRGPGGGWGAPHRLNPRHTVLNDVELAFDAQGNLTGFWRVNYAPYGITRLLGYAVATKPANGAWDRHVRAGPVGEHPLREFVLSVAPSGKAAISWWQRKPDGGFQFTVRVRAAAGAPWGPARALASYPARTRERRANGDVTINDDGTATAAWKVCRRVWLPCEVQRSTLAGSGAWTEPVTLAGPRTRPTRRVLRDIPVEVASDPSGLTAITWARRLLGQDSWWQTVVLQQTAGGQWTREVVPGAHDGLAVGAQGTLAMVKRIVLSYGIQPRGLEVTWRSNGSDWSTTTLAPRHSATATLEPALHIDGEARVFVPWSQIRQLAWDEPIREQGLISTHASGGWRTTRLWDWAPNARFAAAAVAANGRAVAIRMLPNAQRTNTAVVMRVLRPA
jgi:hypothetical protein